MEEKGDERRDASDERHWFRCERHHDADPLCKWKSFIFLFP